MKEPPSLAARLSLFEEAMRGVPVPPDHWESRWEFIRSTDQLILPEEILIDFFIPAAEALQGASKTKVISVVGRAGLELARMSDWLSSDVHLLEEFRHTMFPRHPQVHAVSLALLKITYAVWLGHLPKETIERYQNLWFSLADLCGCWRLRYVMEDEIFAVLKPKEFKLVVSVVTKYNKAHAHVLNEMISIVRHHCELQGLKNLEIYSRRKNIFGIYQKIRTHGKTLGQIRDVFGVRIITDTEADCYKALHVIQKLWPCYQEHFKDYIKFPKPNGYQSLHISVCGLMKQDVEFQIRTRDMHHVAEFGLANHAHYKADCRHQGK